MSISAAVRDQLAVANIKTDRFREIVIRLLSYGVIVRDEDRTEQLLYDDARRVEALLEDYFEVAGFLLHHDSTNQFYRLYAPGAVVDGLPQDTLESVPSLRARVSPDFVATALALRFSVPEQAQQRRHPVAGRGAHQFRGAGSDCADPAQALVARRLHRQDGTPG
jgi:hypothetical protein